VRALLNDEQSLLIAVHIMEGVGNPMLASHDAVGDGDENAGLPRALGDLAKQGVRTITRAIGHTVTSPAQAIADVAREVGADAIVIGTRGHSPVVGLLAGSVTQRLLEIAPCPVVAVPPAAEASRVDAVDSNGLSAGGDVPSPFSSARAREIGEHIGIDWSNSRFDVDQFRMGLEVELEHGCRDPQTNVSDDDQVTTGKIATAHLREFPDYYTRLARMEAEAEAYWAEHEPPNPSGAA
jgi:nucleotide-binding universal stress UspA family protein